MHTVNNRTQLICCVYILYKAGELIITQPYFGHATSVTIYPLGTHVVRTSATEQGTLWQNIPPLRKNFSLIQRIPPLKFEKNGNFFGFPP